MSAGEGRGKGVFKFALTNKFARSSEYKCITMPEEEDCRRERDRERKSMNEESHALISLL